MMATNEAIGPQCWSKLSGGFSQGSDSGRATIVQSSLRIDREDYSNKFEPLDSEHGLKFTLF